MGFRRGGAVHVVGANPLRCWITRWIAVVRDGSFALAKKNKHLDERLKRLRMYVSVFFTRGRCRQSKTWVFLERGVLARRARGGGVFPLPF